MYQRCARLHCPTLRCWPSCLQGIHFRFMPDMRQVSHALQVSTGVKHIQRPDLAVAAGRLGEKGGAATGTKQASHALQVSTSASQGGRATADAEHAIHTAPSAP